MRMSELITGLRHIGIIVRDAEKSTKFFKDLFDLKEEDITTVSPDVTKGESSFSFIPAGGLSWS